jgi:hypothetical protein
LKNSAFSPILNYSHQPRKPFSTGNIMATAPITSTAARDQVFANRNEELKSFAPKNKVNDTEVIKAKDDVNKAVEAKAARDTQESKQSTKPVQETKPTPVVNTRGELTGGTINTSA